MRCFLSKIAFIFPGQSSQYIGMGKDLYDKFASFRNIIEKANGILGYNLEDKIFHGSEENLCDTLLTQPSVFTISVAIWGLLNEEGIVPQFVAGHSLGEYSALVSSGILDFENTLKIVIKRAEFIREASKQSNGSMAAVLGLDKEVLETLCSEGDGDIEPVNFNCPGQIVVSGSFKGCKNFVNVAGQKGAKRVVVLKVSGPFHHSKFMLNARNKMNDFIKNITFNDSNVPFVSNNRGKIAKDGLEIKQLLIDQINHPVYWEDCINTMLNEGVNVFVEVGPGKTLTGLLKRISRNTKGLNVSDINDLNNTLNFLKDNLV